MTSDSTLPAAGEIGRWRIAPRRREVRHDGLTNKLVGRAFDVLVALIEARGAVVCKDALIQRVWPGRIIEENTLEAQIAAVRRALEGDRDLVRTVPGRGYQFVGEFAEHADGGSPTRPVPALPAAVSELIGRQAAFEEIQVIAATHRLVTLVGAGGVGKTRLALEVARHLVHRFPDGVSLVELGPLSSAEHVPAAVAGALGFEHGSGTASLDGIASVSSTRQARLVLDNCEHLIDAAAEMADTLLRAGPAACVIATSREPLRAQGEYVYRVASLDVPTEDQLDPAEILACGAIRLFDARAQAAKARNGEELELALLKAQICRRLDGIPLAIELAAARVQVFGIKGVAERLDDRFHFLTGGGRTVLPRQKTLRATLDWSFDLLSESESAVLVRLSIFSGQFSFESASAVVADQELPGEAVVECLANLVEKSLVSIDTTEATPKYFLLETTRVYARDKLEVRGGLPEFSRRHAKHHFDLFVRAEAEWEVRPTGEWIAVYSQHIDDLRAAIAWAFSPHGDPEIGSALATAALPLWLQLSLLEECLANVETVLEYLDREGVVNARWRMKLHAARGASLLYQGAGAKTTAAFNQALAFADEVGDSEYQLRAIWGLWGSTYLGGGYRAALALAERFVALAATRPGQPDRLVGDRMRGMSRYCLGDLAGARDDLERMLERYEAPVYRSHLMRFIYDQEVVARSALAHVLWIQGFAEQAIRAARSAVERARAIDHPPSMCYALTEAVCPVTLLTAGAAPLEASAASAIEATRRHGVSTWKARGQLWQGLWRLAKGESGAYDRMIGPALEKVGEARFVVHYTGFLSAMCEQLGRHGRSAEGLVLVTSAIERAERVGDGCSLVELLRVEGELLLRRGEANADPMAEARFNRALVEARRHKVLAWELRSAMSLARLRHRQDRPARHLLAPVYERFSEGLATADLTAARVLLNSLP
jgi:predicted ATPase/DNA-binding winged helix-turn-helix (wHTH) protein